MKSKIVYTMDHYDYGDDNERSGWYIVRLTIIDDRGVGLEKGSIADRKLVAKFEGAPGDAVFEMRNFSGYCSQGGKVFPSQTMLTEMVKT